MSRRPNGGSIYPHRNGWSAHVWIVTPTRRRQRKSVYGKTREEVHAKWLRLHQQARRGPVAPVSPRLWDFLRRWLRETVKPNLPPATAANYEMFARLYIVPDLGNRPLDKLMVRDVQVWVNALRTRCPCCAQGKDAVRAVPHADDAESAGKSARPGVIADTRSYFVSFGWLVWQSTSTTVWPLT
ncbi:hypothetical protein JQN72_04245 [Phycicoccus sp. CSK15P-2]|uniref:N-terminal phage integrase SAM-like domain-containing protein n=1 Tax=Phycicoccus sp. CSK15P-2 TaxID=2807627 RepID=UPI001950AABA|nr:N-terminal phage integrase SAM-like domain-containing protein [Phycicoccus sp. CSK15P-2]MBM6403454.1 hypothetical protein [Phycicoccus sp. CSK15P-2]